MNENAIDRKLVCAFIDGLISDDGEREKGLEYIRSMPPVNPQPCDDAISRAEAVRVASGYCHPANVAKELAKMPPVTPQPKTGHWIEKDGFDGDTYYDCSECGESWTTIEGTPWDNEFKYCPNCGCRMVEPQESERKV